MFSSASPRSRGGELHERMKVVNIPEVEVADATVRMKEKESCSCMLTVETARYTSGRFKARSKFVNTACSVFGPHAVLLFKF